MSRAEMKDAVKESRTSEEEETKRCPHCGSEVKRQYGLHTAHYSCTNPSCQRLWKKNEVEK